ncbi:MAG: hypothetical protein V2A56_11620 [bacterium]
MKALFRRTSAILSVLLLFYATTLAQNLTQVGGIFNDWTNGRKVILQGDLAWVLSGEGRITSVDLSDPAKPNRLGTWVLGKEVSGFSRWGHYLVLAAQETGIIILDVATTSSPVEVGRLGTPDCAWDVAVTGSYALVADVAKGLIIIDITNPATPKNAGALKFDQPVFKVAVEDSLLAVGGLSKVFLVSVNKPDAPKVLGDIAITVSPQSLLLEEKRLFISSGVEGLKIVDISKPAAPQLLSTWIPSLGEVSDIALLGKTLFVAANLGGVRRVDITDVTNPKDVGGVPRLGTAWGVAANRNLVAAIYGHHFVIYKM